MKKFICSFLILIMGFACLNIGAISEIFIKENNQPQETIHSESFEKVKQNNKQAKEKALPEAATNEITLVYTVTFDCNGGEYNGVTTFQIKAIAGKCLIKPDSSKLERKYYTFGGWFTDKGVSWNFDTDIVNEDLTLKAKWHCEISHDIDYYGAETYFTDKYPLTSNWNCISHKSTANTTGCVPINVQGSAFPNEDVLAALKKTGIDSSYGGCGPIAMMGILDYFSRYLGYTSIMNDPTDEEDRIALAYQVFMNTTTYTSGLFSSKASDYGAALYSDAGDKSTITYPWDYVDGFNTIMKEYYHLDEQIKADYTGILTSKNTKINKIKQSIDKGYPSTIYVSAGGSGYFGNHFVNVYAYETWQGVDGEGNITENTVFVVRVNWKWSDGYIFLMDADLLGEPLSGVIYYDVKYDNQLIRPSDFATEFVNANGQGQYFFYEKTADITTANGFKFGTTRLRCGYIENQFLVLSANRVGAGRAYLEMNFDIEIKAMNFDISLWSSRENRWDYIKLFRKDENGEWQEHLDIRSISGMKDYPNNRYISFPDGTTGIKFEVYTAVAESETNKGRVVIGDMNLFY